jgi:hypothetical protein
MLALGITYFLAPVKPFEPAYPLFYTNFNMVGRVG